MDREALKQILVDEMKQCIEQRHDVHSYLTVNDFGTYTITTLYKMPGKCLLGTVLVVRLEDNRVIVELDHTNRLFAHGLKARGVPDEQIVVAYIDKTILTDEC